MKTLSLSMALFAAFMLFAAEGAKNHITGQFELLKAGKNLISNKDGIVTVTLFQKINSGGAREIFQLNQSKPAAIEFGAESKLDTDLDGKSGVDYCVYVDLVYADGSRTYQLIAPFSAQSAPQRSASRWGVFFVRFALFRYLRRFTPNHPAKLHLHHCRHFQSQE